MSDDIKKEAERIHEGIVASLSFSEALAKRDTEIERLRQEKADILAAKEIVFAPPAIPEGFVIQELQKANVALHADIARLTDRLRSGARCPHCDELRLELGEARGEIDRLRGLLVEIGKQHRKLAGLVRGAQVPLGANDALDVIERCVREALGE